MLGASVAGSFHDLTHLWTAKVSAAENVAPWQADTEAVLIDAEAARTWVALAGMVPVTALRSSVTPVGFPLPPHPSFPEVIAPALIESIDTMYAFGFVTVMRTGTAEPPGCN